MENLYYKVYEWENLILAWRKARKGKSRRLDVKEFEENLIENLQQLQFELMTFRYRPLPLTTFPIRDPKTRLISKSDFRDRIIHHALINIIQDVFEKSFIYDSCANQKGKGALFSINRFDKFKRQVTNNLQAEAFCLKADIKHYFREVDHRVLLKIIQRKIKCQSAIFLIKQILQNVERERERDARYITKGVPLGNLTSQFFANVYLHELDYFVKHELKIRYYIRYVDDFIILHKSKKQLEEWLGKIDNFLKLKLRIELHLQKTKISSLSRGVDFVGFRNFWYKRLLRKRNIRQMKKRVELYENGQIPKLKFLEILQGWLAYAKWEIH